MLKGIGHMGFVVADMPKSLHFYRDVLGFKFFKEMEKDGKPWIAFLELPSGQTLELFYGGERRFAPRDETAGFMHMCLEVDDIQSVPPMLIKNGVKVDVMPAQGKDRNWQCWAKDPDGNKIEFMQIDAASPQAKA